MTGRERARPRRQVADLWTRLSESRGRCAEFAEMDVGTRLVEERDGIEKAKSPRITMLVERGEYWRGRARAIEQGAPTDHEESP